jgi:branched-chain amino acid transport system substrate-binding protein
VIGNIGTYTGVIGSIFTGVQQYLNAAITYLNAHGGLNGHPVKLISQDDGGDPSKNETEAQNMVQNDGAIGFVAQYTPLSSSGSVQFLSSKGIPVVGGDLYDPNWYGNPDWFPQGTSLEPAIAASFLSVPKSLGKTKVGYLYCTETPICSGGAAYDQAHPVSGVSMVYSAPISLTQPSFTAQCLDAQSAGAQVLAVAADPASLQRVGDNCAAQGVHIQLEEPAVSTTNSQPSDPNLAGMLAPLEDFLWFQNNTPATQLFQQTYKTLLPSLPVTENAAEVWTAVQLLQIGSSKLSASNPTAAQLMDGLDSLGTTTINGLSPSSLTFQAGSPATGTSCYTLAEISNGSWQAPDGFGPRCN